MDEQLDAILIQVTIPLPLAMIHAAFTGSDTVARWMCDGARIEPRVGGAYELTWRGETPFTSAGTVLRITPDLDIEFSWLAPPDYAELMNRPGPTTQVYVRLQESPEGIDVTLEHSGWGSGPAWEEARSWHFLLWDDRLHLLKEFLLREAYG